MTKLIPSIFRVGFLSILILGFSQLTNAQFNYLASSAVNTTSTYSSLTAAQGTAITTNFKGTAMTFDDDNSSVQNIGFTFAFSGQNFTQFVLNSNGFIRLGSDSTPIANSYNVLTTTTTPPYVLYPLNLDLDGGTSPEYRVFTSGTAGSRVCTIQFKNVKDWSSTTGQFSALEFQIKLYEGTNVIEFVYHNFTPSAAASAFIPSNCGIMGTAPLNSVNVTKASTTAFASATFIDGAYTGNAFNLRNSVLPVSGLTYRFTPIVLPNNDASVLQTYTLGKIPKGLNHIVSATIKNSGATTRTNLAVTLTVTGANPFTNTQTIPSLTPGQTIVVYFAAMPTSNIGSNTVVVNVPPDDVNTNNSISVSNQVTSTTYSTAYGTVTTSGVGSNGGTIELATTFKCPQPSSISSIIANFSSSGQPYLVKIYSIANDTPQNLLYTSASLTTVAGPNAISLTPAVSIPGDFAVSLSQTGTTNYGCSYEAETPIREKTFYSKGASGPWGALSAPFKLMLDVTLSAVLPITLTNFSGVRESGNNILNWTTANETNNKGFELQRSANGEKFSTIATIASKAENGNSSSALYYSYNDNKPLVGTNYYRLHQIDFNGKESFSNIVVLKSASITKAEITRVYPNPVDAQLNIVLNTPNSEKVQIRITDLVGKVITEKVLQTNQGDNNVQFNTSNLSRGTYLIRVYSSNNSEMSIQKFIKQ